MIYRVFYYCEGKELGDSPCDRSLQGAKDFARDGLNRHGADTAKIIDNDGAGTLVATVVRDD